MSGLFEHQQIEEQDNLKEYRGRRMEQVEASIVRLHCQLIEQVETAKKTALELGLELKKFKDEKLWNVDGWNSMSHYVANRHPRISKQRLSQLLASAEVVEAIMEWNAGVNESDDSLTLPVPESEFAARTAAAIPRENLIPTYALASEASNGRAPTAQQIADADAALTGNDAAVVNGKSHTDARIDRLDFEPSGKWVDARPAPHEEIANLPKPERPEPRRTEDLSFDGHRMSFQLIVPRHSGQSALKYYGFHSRRQIERAGFVFVGNQQRTTDDAAREQEEEEDDTAPTPRKEPMSPVVREKLLEEQKRLEAIGAPVLFADKLRDCPPEEDDEPLQASFIAGDDLSYIDQTIAGFTGDDPQ